MAALVGLALPAVAAENVLDGVKKYEAGDYGAAFAIWQPLAEAGNPDALFNLGQVYRLGRGVAIDIPKAIDHYRQAAKRGHIAAMGNLGTLYFFAEPPNRRRDEAIAWWRRAAERGYARAQYMLGVLYFNGDQVERDYVTAYAWMTLAVTDDLDEARAAEIKMRRHLSVQELAQGRILARTLVASDRRPYRKPEKTAVADEPAVAVLPEDPPPAPSDEPVTLAPVAESTPPTAPPARVSAVPAAPAERQVDSMADASGGWRLQMAAMRSAEKADLLRQSLLDKDTDLLGGLEVSVARADLGPDKGIFYRVHVGPFADRDAALRRCDVLKSAGRSCYPVAP